MIPPVTSAIDLECRVREVFYTYFSEEQLHSMLLTIDEVDITEDGFAIFAAIFPDPFHTGDVEEKRNVARQMNRLAQDLPRLLVEMPDMERDDAVPFTPLRLLYENVFHLVMDYLDDELALLLRLKAVFSPVGRGAILSPSARTLYGVFRADYVSRARGKPWLEMWPGRARTILGIEDTYGWEGRVQDVLTELIDACLVQQASCDDEAYILTPTVRAGLLEKFEMLEGISPDDPLHEEAERVALALMKRRQQEKQMYDELLTLWTQDGGTHLFEAMKMATDHKGPSYIHAQMSEIPDRLSNGKIGHRFLGSTHYLFDYESAEIAWQEEGGLVLPLERFSESQQHQVEQGLERSDVQGFDAALARFWEQAAQLLDSMDEAEHDWTGFVKRELP